MTESTPRFDFVATDVETNGLDPRVDEILEIAVIEFNLDGEVGEIYHQFCRPMSGFIPEKVSKINKITMDMVDDKPNYLRDGIQKEVAEFIGKRKVIGHNLINFDLKFIKIKPKSTDDTLIMCRKEHSGRNNLKAACKRHGIDWNDDEAHGAKYDTLKTIELYCSMIKPKIEKEIKQSEMPLFSDLEEVKPADVFVKKFGVVPSDEDKKMMATQAYSFSRINLFHQCPFKWYMQYIKGVKEPPKDYFDTGKICHSTAEWTGDWCYRTLFANKFEAFFSFKKYTIGPKTLRGLGKEFGKEANKVTFHDFGLYLYDNPHKIKKYFTDCRGKADFINLMDLTIQENMYEKPSMPPMEVYDKIIEEAIKKHKCSNPDVIKDVKKIMYRFYDLKDFALMPGDVTITEKRLAFDKDWKVLSDFFANNVFFRGIIDVIDYFGDHIIITDYKTSRTMLTVEQLKEDRQMQIYLLLVYLFIPKDSYRKMTIRIDYVRFGKSIEYDVVDVKSAADKALDWINSSIQEIEKEMLKTDGTAFKPNRNEYCHNCHLAEDAKCPLFDKRIVNDIDDPYSFVVADIEDCQHAWKRIEANKAENSRLTKLCKNFVKGCSNTVKIDENAALDFYTKSDVSCNTEEAMKLLLKKNIDIKYLVKFLNITPTSLAALCESKDIKLTKEEVDKICIRKVKTEFKALTEEEAKKGKFLNS